MSLRSFLMPAASIVVVVAVAFFVIFQLADSEAQKGLESWRDRMNLVADSRAAQASEWLNRHLNNVELIADDASVQLYATTIVDADDPDLAEAQRGYVFSLLSAEAEKSGFHEQRAIDTIAANVKRPNRAGLALIAGNGHVLVASPGMPPLRPEELLNGEVRSFVKIGPSLADKTPLMLIGAPVITSNDGTLVSAWIIGARPLDQDFQHTLIQPGDDSKSAETYLIISGSGDIVTPITPLAHGGKLGEAKHDAAASFAARQPGGFGQYNNYDDRLVLVTGRELSAPVPWILVRTVETREAFADINADRNNLIITISLAALAIAVLMILVWRHGVSRRLESSYHTQAALSERNEALSRFLRAVSDGQPTAIAALEADMTVRFANKQMGDVVGIPAPELENRRLDTAFDNETASLLREKTGLAAKGEAQAIPSLKPNISNGRQFQTQLLHLSTGGESSAEVLLVMQEITDLVAANERSEALFRRLIGTLTQIIDARDPWSKHHSARVADVAVAIGREMGWKDDSLETLEIAGQLVNLGKIFVPIDILTKQSPLTEKELGLVRESMRKGTQLISGIDLIGPVSATLDQMSEHWDGSGTPEGRKGDEIEPGARILSVANAFVGIVSARAHRESLGFDKAIDILHEEAGKSYERKVVAALQNILENKQGREQWADYTQMPASD